jgi:hypothetical protein
LKLFNRKKHLDLSNLVPLYRMMLGIVAGEFARAESVEYDTSRSCPTIVGRGGEILPPSTPGVTITIRFNGGAKEV